MGLLGALIPWWARWVAVGLLCIASAGYGALKMNERNWRQHENTIREYAEHRAKVQMEAKAAAERAQAIGADYELRAEEANHAHAMAVADLRARVKRLRDERDRDRGSFVPPAAAATKCPDAGVACFERAELERAVGEFVAGLRALVDEGDKVIVDFNAARAWAKKGEAK